MATFTTGAAAQRPTYSKIAASGLKPSIPQQTPNNGTHIQKSDLISAPQDGIHSVSPSNDLTGQGFTPKQKYLIALAKKDSKSGSDGLSHGPEVQIHTPDPASPSGKDQRAPDGMLMPNVADDAGTQISSSSTSGKPPSLDGKSVTSGTTFALDEKGSIRPDDSASVNATEDEDLYQVTGSGLPASRTGSDDGVRAFRDQLREISSIQPTPSGRPQVLGHGGHPAQGVLYIPPEGSGVGIVPGSIRAAGAPTDLNDLPPDPKLLEALDSPKDRIMVLKLEQDIVDFVKDAKESSLTLPQTNAFYRMLAHKLADYYMLGHHSEESTSAVRIFKTPTCRLPPPLTGIATPSTAASTPPPIPPQMKILRRGADGTGPTIANGSNTASKTTSENGESGNDDRRSKLPASREEREAKYEEARKRIMGSAKPESPEASVPQDDSRSSSAAGKKNGRRKHQNDSDDDFEARSAYSAYYPPPFTSAGPPPAYGYPQIVGSQGGQYTPGPYGVQDASQGFPNYGASGNPAWTGNNFSPQQPSSPWTQNQQPGYDLSSNFQRVMAFQPPPMSPPNPGMQQPYNNAPYGQQYGPAQQQWPQQPAFARGYPPQVETNYMQGYPAPQQQQQQQQPPQHSGPFTPGQAYPYGQLPSQAFPGRPASNLEHPLPGSYKSKHFNPQSQSFVPGHGHINATNGPPFTPQGIPYVAEANRNGYNMPYSPQRQNTAPSPNATQSSPQPPPSTTGPARAPNQPMVHPLPQPVFPRQPSPNVPLPPKPAEQNTKRPFTPSDSSSGKQNQSSIAKWGTPASLPAKPPPSAEPFDPAKFAQAHRQAPSHAPVRGAMPSFGSMPPMASAYGGANGGQGRGL